ncbi:hypothetical protein BHECKSOX2_849 [Bathymodiolus heckerae thiotrophic gill symbiont]|nr:hypothetical protein [Bathymodiolus heckerae thiotrophic gill symbiont]SMN13726.1 hypothetical protein BHECKSOX2_849 [Bathymodiolus heckerae thiotrophic gill symbiont]
MAILNKVKAERVTCINALPNKSCDKLQGLNASNKDLKVAKIIG